MARRSSAAVPESGQIPIQPVNNPILCNPYRLPDRHWVYDTQTGDAREEPVRRSAGYWYKTKRTGSAQMSLSGFAEENFDDLPLVNLLREDVARWRGSKYENATQVTKQLLAWWAREDRERRLFFCQLEAVETIIYLAEILGSGRRPRWNPKLSIEDYQALMQGRAPGFIASAEKSVVPTLMDRPNEAGTAGLVRYGCKMATGSGKTVVMAMLLAWAFCNRGRVPGDTRFPDAALIVCPNLTIRDRLQVLRPETRDNYFEQFDVVPSQLMPEMQKGKVLVTNWHLFAPESEHSEGGETFRIVQKGEENPEAFAKRTLQDLAERGRIMVLNDEGHHAYRPKPVGPEEKISAEEKAEREEATVWVSGLDRLNKAVGIQFCVDLSATPFYIGGSGHPEGSPFPWIVSDFGLVDAIESGIVKIPRLPVATNTGRPDPEFLKLWEYVNSRLQPGEKLNGGKPKPEAAWREAEAALRTLASQWIERFRQIAAAKPGQDVTPPVLIIVCDNTDIAEHFFGKISGEEVIEIADAMADEDDEDDEEPKKRGKKPRTKTIYHGSVLFPEFSNSENLKPTLRIDSKLLADAEAGQVSGTKKEAAARLREIVASVGRQGKPGAQVRCVVSVQMLTEGWDANNVTHVFGLRAFESQLLCEQVVGRGLRRMDYTIDPQTDLLTEEYVDIYGVPFSIIPFRGRGAGQGAPEDKPKNHVRAEDARKAFEIQFPIVEGYAFALKRNLVRCDVKPIPKTEIQPQSTPTAVFVKPQVGYQVGHASVTGGFETELQDREQYYRSVHLQTIKFVIARAVLQNLVEGVEGGKAKLKLRARNSLFPQVLRYVDEYVDSRVEWKGQNKSELGLEIYVKRIVDLLTLAIEPDEGSGEPPLLPILNRYKSTGSTSAVNFKTVKAVTGTTRSHVNWAVCDTGTWEQQAVFALEAAKKQVLAYTKNDHLEFTIPYEYLGTAHVYYPDFLVKLADGTTLILEIKGQQTPQDNAKHQAAARWVSAVNRWGQLGKWNFGVCREPVELRRTLEKLAAEPAAA
jgi:type III restriction enzyme